MHAVLIATVVALSLVLALAGGLLSLLDRTADRLLLGLAGPPGVAVVVQSVVAGTGLPGRAEVRSGPTFVGYLLGAAVVLPVAVGWARADRNRWSGAVVALGGLTVAVMTARLVALWQGRA